MDARRIAATCLADVIQNNRALDRVMPALLEQLDNVKDRAFVQELCYGVLRWYPRLEFILSNLSNKPLRKKDTDIKLLLLTGFYQLEYLRTPAHAAVSATVNAARELGKDWACPMINAVLRRYQREQEQIQQQLASVAEARYAHPQWLIAEIKKDWPQHWQTILDENNHRPPMHLRVNQRLISRNDYLAVLQQSGHQAVPSTISSVGLRLEKPADVTQLPGFAAGQVSVQDCAAQLAATLLDLKPGQRVLDACAAPGGKTAHIYESRPDLEQLAAVEINPHRLRLLTETIQRLHVKADSIHADAADTGAWWNGICFDRILLDVPCSATGVMRRHPDIKLMRQPAQIGQFSVTQSGLLDAIWPLLKPAGKMVYATCSILARENDLQIESFLRKHKDVRTVKIDAPWGIPTRYGRQTLPGYQDDSDGFYYSVLEKIIATD